MNQKKRLMLIAGGTGGHVFPGIAVASRLLEQGWQVRWLGTANHIEANLVPKNGIEIDFVHIFGLHGKGIKPVLTAPLFILKALNQARIAIKRFNPNVVLGMGGYVSGPGVLAAWFLGIPIVLHEQNSIAGFTNKLLAKITAGKVIQAFPGAFPHAEVVGNPIRSSLLNLKHPKIRFKGRDGPIKVLILGGSQGSAVLNDIMPKVVAKLGNKVIIWHQSGKGSQQVVKQAYFNIDHHNSVVTEFIDDIASAYNWADIVVCRSGALTVSEIATVGLPAIFIPFQHKDQQQYWNALKLEKVGAAKIFEQSKLTVDAIVNTFINLDREKIVNMAQLARTIAITNATDLVVKQLYLSAKNY